MASRDINHRWFAGPYWIAVSAVDTWPRDDASSKSEIPA